MEFVKRSLVTAGRLSEDAEPLAIGLGDGWFVAGAFDGLGGAGSERYRRKSDGQERTGAFLGARVAARAVEAASQGLVAVATQAARQRVSVPQALGRKLADDLHGEFKSALDNLDKLPSLLKYRGNLSLPTTVALVLGRVTPRSSATGLVALWLGDSHAYCFSRRHGLQLLTTEEFDPIQGADGFFQLAVGPRGQYLGRSMAEALHAENTAPLRSASFMFDDALFVVAVTDGVYDAFNQVMAFERALLDDLVAARSAEAFGQAFGDRVDKIRQDDATFALALIETSWPQVQQAARDRMAALIRINQESVDDAVRAWAAYRATWLPPAGADLGDLYLQRSAPPEPIADTFIRGGGRGPKLARDETPAPVSTVLRSVPATLPLGWNRDGKTPEAPSAGTTAQVPASEVPERLALPAGYSVAGALPMAVEPEPVPPDPLSHLDSWRDKHRAIKVPPEGDRSPVWNGEGDGANSGGIQRPSGKALPAGGGCSTGDLDAPVGPVDVPRTARVIDQAVPVKGPQLTLPRFLGGMGTAWNIQWPYYREAMAVVAVVLLVAGATVFGLKALLGPIPCWGPTPDWQSCGVSLRSADKAERFVQSVYAGLPLDEKQQKLALALPQVNVDRPDLRFVQDALVGAYHKVEDTVIKMQSDLNALGQFSDAADGKIGPRTKDAWFRYRRLTVNLAQGNCSAEGTAADPITPDALAELSRDGTAALVANFDISAWFNPDWFRGVKAYNERPYFTCNVINFRAYIEQAVGQPELFGRDGKATLTLNKNRDEWKSKRDSELKEAAFRLAALDPDLDDKVAPLAWLDKYRAANASVGGRRLPAKIALTQADLESLRRDTDRGLGDWVAPLTKVGYAPSEGALDWPKLRDAVRQFQKGVKFPPHAQTGLLTPATRAQLIALANKAVPALADDDARKKLEEAVEAKRNAEEEAKIRADAESKHRAEEAKSQTDAKRKEAEAQAVADAETKRKEEDAKAQAAAAAKRQEDDAAKAQAAAEAKRVEEEAAKAQASLRPATLVTPARQLVSDRKKESEARQILADLGFVKGGVADAWDQVASKGLRDFRRDRLNEPEGDGQLTEPDYASLAKLAATAREDRLTQALATDSAGIARKLYRLGYRASVNPLSPDKKALRNALETFATEEKVAATDALARLDRKLADAVAKAKSDLVRLGYLNSVSSNPADWSVEFEYALRAFARNAKNPGMLSPDVEVRLQKTESENPPPPRFDAPVLATDRERIQKIQIMLAEVANKAVSADGKWGGESKKLLAEVLRQQGLGSNGTLTEAVVLHLLGR